MSRPPQSTLARRALIEDPPVDAQKWKGRGRFGQGLAVVGVTVLGLGVAGSAGLAGNAQYSASAAVEASRTTAQPSVSVAAGAQAPAAFDRRQVSINRSALRPALGAAAVDQLANQRADSLLTASQLTQSVARAKAAAVRAKSLKDAADHAKKKAQQLEKAELKKAAHKKAEQKAAEQKAERAKRAKAAAAAREKAQERALANAKAAATKPAKAKSSTQAKDSTGAGHASLPITSGFHIAARFGDTGSWSRYHTGIDFAAPMHTPIHAAASGVVTHAGSGSARWAGHYVAIRHADGKSTLYAHMSTVSVHVGERVSGGQRIGAIGMTGRSFGPHVHFELYPAGVKPGNLYHAINPAPWLHAKGLHY